MFIHEMTELECRVALKRAVYGRLGCARDNQPYIVPIYFVYDDDHLYGFTTLGQKVEWMRSNLQVCLEIDERTGPDQWMSVIVLGRYEELPDTPENEPARLRAHGLLQRHAMWWEPAYVATTHRDTPHSFTPIFYRIHIDRLTGHRATPDVVKAAAGGEADTTKETWLARMLRRIRLKRKRPVSDSDSIFSVESDS